MSAVHSGRSREDTILQHVPIWAMRVGLLVLLLANWFNIWKS
jgi:hypothetical protein